MIGLGLSLSAAPSTIPRGLQPGDTVVFLMIGQSNMIGRASYDGGSLHSPSVLQWGRSGLDDGQLITASAPLQHHDPGAGQMGLDISFSEALLAQHPDVSVVFIPSAAGGSGFSNSRWNPGDDLYADAVSRANAVMAANPDFVFGGFIWHQGESDAGNPAYQSDLDSCIAGLRQDVDAADDATPFILGGLVPGWVEEAADRQAIQATINGTPGRVAHTAVSSSIDLISSGNLIHFNAADLRILGVRYWLAWRALNAGLPFPGPQSVGQIPDQTDYVAETMPEAVGSIPDQTDSLSLAAPEMVGTIPNQEDALA
jgi:hypothetical protein